MTKPTSKNPSTAAPPLLPDIDELFWAVEQELDQEKPATYMASSAVPGTPNPDLAALYVRAAAVLSTPDPDLLMTNFHGWGRGRAARRFLLPSLTLY